MWPNSSSRALLLIMCPIACGWIIHILFCVTSTEPNGLFIHTHEMPAMIITGGWMGSVLVAVVMCCPTHCSSVPSLRPGWPTAPRLTRSLLSTESCRKLPSEQPYSTTTIYYLHTLIECPEAVLWPLFLLQVAFMGTLLKFIGPETVNCKLWPLSLLQVVLMGTL